MRVATLIGCVLVLLAAPAHAEFVKLPLIVHNNTVKRPPPGAEAAFVSNKLYINNCITDPCTLSTGFDDARTNHSSLASQPVTLEPWAHGDAKWNEVVQCVRDTFLPFNIEVVTTNPGNVNHSEVMIGGRAAQLYPDLVAGGVAPFIGCGATQDNVISFVFASQNDDVEYLCGAVAQEACHVWGLDHELNALDPMTYLDLGSLKRFQNEYADCGEKLNEERECWCDGAQQNSYQYLQQTFGGANLPPASISIATPSNGQWVKPGFPVRALLDSVLGGTRATLHIDGEEVMTVSPAPFAFNAPMTITGGDHVVTVTGVDGGGRTASQIVNVHVTGACAAGSACGPGMHCLGGYCLPGNQVDGGLGATCIGNDTCITGTCGAANGEQLCTAQCDPGATCPDGFTCLGATGDSGVCWPAADDSGCSTTNGDGSPAFVVFGLGFFAIVLRRRRPE